MKTAEASAIFVHLFVASVILFIADLQYTQTYGLLPLVHVVLRGAVVPVTFVAIVFILSSRIFVRLLAGTFFFGLQAKYLLETAILRLYGLDLRIPLLIIPLGLVYFYARTLRPMETRLVTRWRSVLRLALLHAAMIFVMLSMAVRLLPYFEQASTRLLAEAVWLTTFLWVAGLLSDVISTEAHFRQAPDRFKEREVNLYFAHLSTRYGFYPAFALFILPLEGVIIWAPAVYASIVAGVHEASKYIILFSGLLTIAHSMAAANNIFLFLRRPRKFPHLGASPSGRAEMVIDRQLEAVPQYDGRSE